MSARETLRVIELEAQTLAAHVARLGDSALSLHVRDLAQLVAALAKVQQEQNDKGGT